MSCLSFPTFLCPVFHLVASTFPALSCTRLSFLTHNCHLLLTALPCSALLGLPCSVSWLVRKTGERAGRRVCTGTAAPVNGLPVCLMSHGDGGRRTRCVVVSITSGAVGYWVQYRFSVLEVYLSFRIIFTVFALTLCPILVRSLRSYPSLLWSHFSLQRNIL